MDRGLDFALLEGDDEVQYIQVDISNLPDEFLQPGTSYRLEDLDTNKPRLLLPNGTSLEGKYSTTFGSTLFMRSKAVEDDIDDDRETSDDDGDDDAGGGGAGGRNEEEQEEGRKRRMPTPPPPHPGSVSPSPVHRRDAFDPSMEGARGGGGGEGGGGGGGAPSGGRTVYEYRGQGQIVLRFAMPVGIMTKKNDGGGRRVSEQGGGGRDASNPS